jgi:hypothetical protein
MKLVRSLAVAVLTVLVIGGRLLAPTAAAAAGYANPALLVETDELARVVGSPDVRIVDLRRDADKGEAAYRTAHLPGAVYLSLASWTMRRPMPRASRSGRPRRPRSSAGSASTIRRP